MDEYRGEDEQLEQVKRWLRENGPALLLGIVIAVALVFGWRFWTARQQATAAAASIQYETLLQAAEQWSVGGEAAAAATVGTLAAELKESYPDTGYASYAAFLRANVAVAESRYDEGAAELRWVIDRNLNDAEVAIARYRLARVLLAQGEADAALELVDQPAVEQFAPAYARLRGDILMARGDTDGARQAYVRARELGAQTDLPPDQILEIKLRDLQPASAPDQES